MTETKDFPTLAIASLSTGTLLCDFSSMHEAAEFLMGHSIWTHHFADKKLLEAMRRTILEQCPGFPTDLGEVTNWPERAKQLQAEFGPTVKIKRGSGLTAMLPTDGIPDHLKNKTTIVQT